VRGWERCGPQPARRPWQAAAQAAPAALLGFTLTPSSLFLDGAKQRGYSGNRQPELVSGCRGVTCDLCCLHRVVGAVAAEQSGLCVPGMAGSVFAERVSCVHPVTSLMPALAAAPFPLRQLAGEQSTYASLLPPHCPIPSSPGLWCTGAEMCSGSRPSLAFLLTGAAAANPTIPCLRAQELGG